MNFINKPSNTIWTMNEGLAGYDVDMADCQSNPLHANIS